MLTIFKISSYIWCRIWSAEQLVSIKCSCLVNLFQNFPNFSKCIYIKYIMRTRKSVSLFSSAGTTDVNWVCMVMYMGHRRMVGTIHRHSVLGPLDMSCRLCPPGHTGQIVRSSSHQQELRRSVNYRVFRRYWSRYACTQCSQIPIHRFSDQYSSVTRNLIPPHFWETFCEVYCRRASQELPGGNV